MKAFERLEICSQDKLFALNRPLVNIRANQVNGFTGDLFLAHFKSGGTGVTRSQIMSCASSSLLHWVIAGDMNWDIGRLGELNPPALGYACWGANPTHRSGSILDWVLAEPNVQVNPVDLTGLNHIFDMNGPDHRPILSDVHAN